MAVGSHVRLQWPVSGPADLGRAGSTRHHRAGERARPADVDSLARHSTRQSLRTACRGSRRNPLPPGGRFTYHIHFPDAGIYWYHPHVREDTQQGLGLYGNIRVRSPRPDYYGAAHHEQTLIIGDLLLTDEGALVPFGRDATTHAFMGRFGNVFLVNGEPRWRLTAKRGEVIRFLLDQRLEHANAESVVSRRADEGRR